MPEHWNSEVESRPQKQNNRLSSRGRHPREERPTTNKMNKTGSKVDGGKCQGEKMKREEGSEASGAEMGSSEMFCQRFRKILAEKDCEMKIRIQRRSAPCRSWRRSIQERELPCKCLEAVACSHAQRPANKLHAWTGEDEEQVEGAPGSEAD